MEKLNKEEVLKEIQLLMKLNDKYNVEVRSYDEILDKILRILGKLKKYEILGTNSQTNGRVLERDEELENGYTITKYKLNFKIDIYNTIKNAKNLKDLEEKFNYIIIQV